MYKNKLKMDENTKLKLNNGTEIPVIGFGTYQIPSGKETEEAAKYALKIGYRHIDTAAIYENEESVGKAVHESGIPRKKLFITTKMWNDDQHDPESALNESLRKLQMDYVDLYLIHWPGIDRTKVWKVFEKLYKQGKAKAIGVSNFNVNHLQELLRTATVAPAVNQVEFSPYLYQKDLLDFCRSKTIQLEAYSPLTRGAKLNDAKLRNIADKYNKSTAQILLRWALQHDVVVLPKSTHKNRIKENIDLFNFSIKEEDIHALNLLNENFRTCWNPDSIA